MQQPNNRVDQKYVIAIDVGTSSTKVGLVDMDGNVIAKYSRRYETIYLPDGGAEQDPNEWWEVVSTGAKHVIKESGVNSRDILAIGTTSQWAVTVAVDEQGTPLMNAVSWMDSRGGKYNQQIVGGFPSIQGYNIKKLFKWISIVGIPPLLDGSDSLAHMLYIKNERPDIYKRTYKFLEPMDYINMCLTGKACATHSSNIACLLIDRRKNCRNEYHPWTLSTSGIERSKLPDLLPIEGIVGIIKVEIARDWELSEQTVVISTATDNCVTLIGSGAIMDYQAVAVLGSSGMLVFHMPFRRADLLHSLATPPAALSGRNIFWADTGNTGRVVDTFLSRFIFHDDKFSSNGTPEDAYLRLNQAIAEIPVGSEDLLFLPWLNNGSLAPTADQFLRGGFINLTENTTRSHLARAMLEGIAYNWRWLKEAAESFAKHKFDYWHLTGGGATSDIWAQIMADVVGIPMHQEDNPTNTSLLGMAFLAFIRLGLMELDDIPKKVKIKQTFNPIPSNQYIYNRMYKQFRRCEKKLKPIFHSLNTTH